MIATAISVAKDLLPLEVVRASLKPLSRICLPLAPPSFLVLNDCAFMPFAKQKNQPDPIVNLTGNELTLRTYGKQQRLEFKQEVNITKMSFTPVGQSFFGKK